MRSTENRQASVRASGMERVTISLPPPQMSWLKQEAKRIGITIGELLRRILDQVRDGK